MVIPYNPKIDVALDSLQTFVSCFEALKDEYHEDNLHHHDSTTTTDDCKLLTTMETQAAVNKSILDLIESILAPTYARAAHQYYPHHNHNG